LDVGLRPVFPVSYWHGWLVSMPAEHAVESHSGMEHKKRRAFLFQRPFLFRLANNSQSFRSYSVIGR
jgi:hypothetical protein